MLIEITEEQADILRGLIAEKIDSDHAYYSPLQGVYEALTEEN